MNFFLFLITVGVIAALILLRLWFLLSFQKGGLQPVSVRVLVVAGSGGHTTEILRLLGSLSKDYNPRHYVLADTDKMSAVKIRLFEEKRAERDSESLVLCNGPGTCVPICASALLLGILGIKKVTIVYVESICRVETLSLSGKILYHFSDYFFVQWPALKGKYPKSVYLGRIV
ncbi:UDP-N-acetylglucosamine transferase subunit ALG14 homolog isoform X2 [Dromiciops gliroides]|uniref:UDP-N-acetylglucosamine transferase subunit ALG14 homolog isoform X2 n=1 Tax=Dromiciops gliroides TaxID=33562 RepID=UPI001CC34901|nr:UDP-N-acetylglucosamine transferase subunit ALG14 homolog isoform X2 [Dromiciops gliroides]